ncbi:MAG: hypothetical protein ABH827_01035 [bacterium]
MNQKKISILLLVVFSCFCTHLRAGTRNLLASAKRLEIKSLSQKIVGKNKFVFEEDVEVFFDKKLHIRADRVDVDKQKYKLLAQRKESGAVIIENNDLVMLADSFELNLQNKTGVAKNIRIHVQDGYVFARRAEKIDASRWRIEHMYYTACDHDDHHWSLYAVKAMLHGGYFIRVNGVIFKIGKIPVFILPTMVFPIQGQSRSGLLIPKFYFDYYNGFGFKQEYYQSFSQYCDTTVGLSWRDKKGVVFSDEFRWARSATSFTELYGCYAIAKNSFTQRKGTVLAKTRNRYWMTGKDFRSFDDFLGGNVSSLVKFDFGTDKYIGYQFFNSIDDIDDSFDNSWVTRGLWSTNLVEARVDSNKTFRQSFVDLTPSEELSVKKTIDEFRVKGVEIPIKTFHKKEIESFSQTVMLPHIELNCTYFDVSKFFLYRHDIGVDQVYHREFETDKYYFQSLLAQESKIIPLNSEKLIRFNYQSALSRSVNISQNIVDFSIRPYAQVRSALDRGVMRGNSALESHLFSHGASRLSFEYDIQWALPEGMVHNQDLSYVHYVQPVFSWEYVPRIFQDHWYHIDHWDRIYPKNVLNFDLRNNFSINNTTLDFTITQGYDFYNSKDLFPLRRPVSQKHLLPLQIAFSARSEKVGFSVVQEYEVPQKKMLQTLLKTDVLVGKVHLMAGYLFQHESMRIMRELFSNIPHFILCGFAVPIGEYGMLRYDAQFSSERGKSLFGFVDIQPLIHRVQFEYNGHCWGLSVGYEEKKYREFGNNRKEQAIVFSARFDSLGSFAKKHKLPDVTKAKFGE